MISDAYFKVFTESEREAVCISLKHIEGWQGVGLKNDC